MLKIFLGTACVGHHVEISQRRLVDDEVIYDSSFVVCEDGQCPMVVLEPSYVGHGQALHELNAVPAGDVGL